MLTRARRALLALIAAVIVMLPLTPAPAYALPANPNVSDEVIEANWATLSAEQQEAAKQVVAEAKAEGYSAEAAAAIAGNFWRESHFNVDAVNASSGACGMYQALGDRQTLLFTYNGVSGCSGLKAKETTQAALADGRSEWLGWPTTSIIYGGMASYALNEAGVWGITGGTVPSADDSFGSLEGFKSTDNWYFATWIWMTNWEAPGAAEAGFMERASYAATVLKKVGNTDPAAKSTTSGAQSGSTGGVLDEWSLPGMPKKPEIAKGQSLKFADGSQLTAKQRANASDLKTQLEEERDREAAESARTWVAVVGVVLFVYALVILLSLLIDLSFPLFSVLKGVTFGRIKYSPLPADERPKGTYGVAGVLTVCFAFAALGALIFTGVIQSWLAHLVIALTS